MTRLEFLSGVRELLSRGVEGVENVAYVYLASSTDGVAEQIKLILERQGIALKFDGVKTAGRGADREAGDIMLSAVGGKEQDKT